MDDSYNLAEMSEEEKDELIEQLAIRYNTMAAVSVDLHNACEAFAVQLRSSDKMGHRGDGIRSVATRLNTVALIARAAMGIDEQRLREDIEFEDIVSRLEDD